MNPIPSILIITKDKQSRGGVGNYFRLFFDRFEDGCANIRRVQIGSRAKDYRVRRSRVMAYAREYIKDVLGIVKDLRRDASIRIVQVNPSLIPIPLLRDGLILLLAKWLKRKTVVFFRGWSDQTAVSIEKKWIWRHLFAATYGSASHAIVLAEDFVQPLIRWGVKPERISVSKTMFDGTLVRPRASDQSDLVQFLFLSRISEAKGVHEILEACAMLKTRGLRFHVSLRGHGAKEGLVDSLKSYAKRLGLAEMCQFESYVDGEDKFTVYSKADVFLLPTYHAEGCPTAAVEAMAAGLFLICTDVGALKEIVKDGENGSVVRPRDPKDLADKMEWAIRNIARVRALGEQNHLYAFGHFEARHIVGQITGIYQRVLDGQ